MKCVIHAPKGYYNQLQSSQEQYNHPLPEESRTYRNLKEEDSDYEGDTSDESSDNDGTASGDEDSDADEQEEERERDSQNNTSSLFPRVLMTVLVLEQMRQLIFRSGMGEDER